MSSTPAPSPAERTDTARLIARTVRIDSDALTAHGADEQRWPRTEPQGADAQSLLDALPAERPLAWLRRGDGIVGWGEATRIETHGARRFEDASAAWAELTRRAIVRDDVHSPGTGAVAFGSFAFAEQSSAGGVLVVPQVILGRRGDTTWLTVMEYTEPHAATTSIGSLHVADLMDLLATRPITDPVAVPGDVEFTQGALSPEIWKERVADAVELIRNATVDKVVLARDVIARAQNPLDARALLANLARDYPTCWTFSVDGLIGATPEMLVRSEGGLVTSRVLAGTIRRTGDDDADLTHAATLARSSKDLGEHEFAVRSVADALAPFCTGMNVPDAPFVLHLPNVMHLASDVTAVLAEADGVRPTSLDLAAALHPSAAVCGTPTTRAAEVIATLEEMDRDRYAGPVGWLGADGDGEWGIGLRSGRIDAEDQHVMRLFAGCGIVGASDPEDELAESEAKLQPMRGAFGSA